MTLHRASGQWRLGLALALTTAACWATLPIALKVSLEALDPITLTWFRFLVAAGLMGAWLAARGRLGAYRTLGRRGWGLYHVRFCRTGLACADARGAQRQLARNFALDDPSHLLHAARCFDDEIVQRHHAGQLASGIDQRQAPDTFGIHDGEAIADAEAGVRGHQRAAQQIAQQKYVGVEIERHNGHHDVTVGDDADGFLRFWWE